MTDNNPQASAAAHEKLNALKELLERMGSVAVAFSGGVDSTFLSFVCHEVLADNMLAVTLGGRSMPERDKERAQKFCEEHGIPHELIFYDELEIAGFRENPTNRCYHCKKALFTQMKELTRERSIAFLVDGSNKDDEGDYRPGLAALEELGIESPLREVGMTKAEIRDLSHELGLPTWDMPAAACLASRFAYGDVIDALKLKRVELAEDFLHDLGFAQLRVRCHGKDAELARIEVDADQIEMLANKELREKISNKLRSLGFSYVSLDLCGFRSGAMNEVL